MIMEKHIVTIKEHIVKWEGNQDCGPSGLQSHNYSLRRTPGALANRHHEILANMQFFKKYFIELWPGSCLDAFKNE